MITKLTDAQIAKFPEYVTKWTAIGLSTAPADRPRAEAAIAKMYAVAGLAAPRIVWCGAPLSQGVTRALVASVGSSVGSSVWNSVGSSVRNSVGGSVRSSVGDSVRSSVASSVRNSVGDSVRSSVWNSVGDSVGDSVGSSVGDSVYGAHDAGWLAFYRFFRDECGLSEKTARLEGLWELCQSAGWALPHEHICWVSERHSVLRRNDSGRLHCEDGPALAYPDGWELWVVHGVAVDEQIVMRPETQTLEQIEADDNAESKRVRIERFGWPRYLRESGASVVAGRHNERDAQDEQLYVLRDGGKRFVCVDPSTGRKYALGVPKEITSCEQAQLWMSHGLDRLAIHRS